MIVSLFFARCYFIGGARGVRPGLRHILLMPSCLVALGVLPQFSTIRTPWSFHVDHCSAHRMQARA